MIEKIDAKDKNTAVFQVRHRYGHCTVTLTKTAAKGSVELVPSGWDFTLPSEVAEQLGGNHEALEAAAMGYLNECCMEVMQYAHDRWFRRFGWGEPYQLVTD